MPARQQLFATYVDVVAPETGERVQYVVLPSRPQFFNGVTTAGPADEFYFHRHQTGPTHRAQWGWREMKTPEQREVMLDELGAYSRRDGWKPGPVVVVDMTITELDELVRSRRTPYRLLTRFTKAAKRQYDYGI